MTNADGVLPRHLARRRMSFAKINVAMLALVAYLPVVAAVELGSLNGSEWGTPGDGVAFVQFREHRVIGNGGCNSFSGSYARTGRSLRIGPLAVTRKMCVPDVMEQERAFIRLLAVTRTATATHKTLTLRDDEGQALGTLVRRDWD